ncbi:MAG TPA: NAD(P)-dependent glycerol-3-phosphate dehydrogenase [Gammaproteobacteria bacterium]|nr:NAD(P)-dependent glycerol-3-phosphate dehydrogenase [Gammaproteobacteria bacterium]
MRAERPLINRSNPILVLGAGSWGTALALVLARNKQKTLLWAHDAGHLQQMESERCNARYFPNIPFPDDLQICVSLKTASTVQDILLAIPCVGFRQILEKIKPHIHKNSRIAWATKGLEPGTGKLLHEVAREVLGETIPLAVLSGPTFAGEVAQGLPTAITLAATDESFAAQLVERLHQPSFRVYTSSDIIGAEVGGAVKNVLAIATGIADGLGLGANTRAALITRGLSELMRLGTKLGAQQETLMGLTGVGDVILTCTDDQSRNRRFGLSMARGHSVQDALNEIGQAVEGVKGAKEITGKAHQLGIEMPICEQIYQVVYENLSPGDAAQALLRRSPKSEVAT